MQSGADYQLKWPRQLFRSEAYALVNNTGPQDWSERCELLLEDAFVGVAPRDDFTAIQNSLDKQFHTGQSAREAESQALSRFWPLPANLFEQSTSSKRMATSRWHLKKTA